MSLTKILEEIKNVKPLAEEDVESGSTETLTARRGRKNQSIEAMKRLKVAYTNELRQTAAFIVVIGDKRNEFAQFAVEQNRCFKSDPEEFYLDLINRVPKALYLGKESMANIFDVLSRHLEDKALEMNIVGYPQLIFRQEYHKSLKTQADFLDLVKRAVTQQVGGELVGIQAAFTLTDEAIGRNNAAKFTPVVLPSGDEPFALRVAEDLEKISTRVFVVVAGQVSEESKQRAEAFDAIFVNEASEDETKKALKFISKSLKK